MALTQPLASAITVSIRPDNIRLDTNSITTKATSGRGRVRAMYNAAPPRVVTVIILPLLCGESATLPQITAEMKLLSD